MAYNLFHQISIKISIRHHQWIPWMIESCSCGHYYWSSNNDLEKRTLSDHYQDQCSTSDTDLVTMISTAAAHHWYEHWSPVLFFTKFAKNRNRPIKIREKVQIYHGRWKRCSLWLTLFFTRSLSRSLFDIVDKSLEYGWESVLIWR